MKNKYYSTKFIVNETGLTDFTLRKYIRELEDHGYKDIKRDSNNHRLYSRENVAAITQMVKMIQEEGNTISDSAVHVVQNKDAIHSEIAKSNPPVESNDSEILKELKAIREDNKRLEEKIGGIYSFVEIVLSENKRIYKLLDEDQRLQLGYKEDESSVMESETIRNEDENQTTIDEYINEDDMDGEGSATPLEADHEGVKDIVTDSNEAEETEDKNQTRENANDTKEDNKIIGFFRRLLRGK